MTRFSRNALMTEGDNAGKWGGGKVNNVNALNGNYQVNHIVPVELISDQRSIFRQIHNSNFRDDFLEIFDPSNVRSNGVALNIDLHNGSHPDYTRFVSEQIDVLLGKHGLNPSDTTTLSKAKLQAFATDLSDLTNKIRFLSSPTFLENPANTLKVNGAKVDIENAFDRAFGNNGQLESKEAKRYRALLSLDKEFMVLADTLGTEIVNGKRVFYGAEFLDGYIAFAKTKGIDIGTANFDSQAFKSLLRDANVREEMIGWLKDNGHDDALTGLSGLTARIKSTSISVRRLEDDRSREEVRAFRRAFRSLDSQLSSFLGEEYLDIAKKGLGKTALRIGGAALVAAASAPASFAMSLYDIGKLESETNGGLSELGYRAVTYARTRVDGSTESFSFIQRAYFPSSYLLSLSDAGLRRGDRNNYVIISRNDLDKKDVVLDILGVREGVLYERNDGDYIISQAPFHPNANLGDGELPIQDITISEEDIFRGTGDAFGNFVKSYDSYRSVASGFYANASHEVDGDGNLTISGTHRSDNADYFLGSNAYGYETNVNVASISNALADVGISGFDANSLQVIDFSTDPDLGGILRSVKIAVKAGDGRDVEAVLVDADKDGRLDMAQIIGRTDSGDLISEPASLLDGEGKWFDRYDYPGSEARLDFFQGLGGSIGSSIGNFLFDTDLGRLVGTPVLSSIGTFFGATLAGAIDSEATIGNALYETVDSLPSALSQALESSAIGQFSSALTAELMEGIGIEGVWGEVASTVTSTTISNIVTNVLDDGISAWNAGLDFGNLFDGSTYTSTGGEVGGTANVSSALASAVLNYAASAVADEVYTANTEIGSYAASVFGTVLGFVGSFYGGPLLGAAGQFVGQAGGAYAGDAYTWANDHQRYIGHHFGMTFGLFEAGAVLRLLGARPPKKPSAEAETHLSLESGYFVLGDVTSVAGGNEKFVRNLAESTRDSVNYIIGLVTENSEIAPNSNTSDLSYTFRHDHLGRVFLNGREVASANDAINAASIEAIENTEIKGGDLFIKRVIQNSSASSITAMSADLQIARDYGIYFRNKEVIDRAISAPYDSLSQSDKSFYVANSDVITRYMAAPKDHEGNLVQDQSLSLDVDDIAWLNETENGLLNKDRVLDLVPQLEVSQFAAGWIVTLQRASELGLDKAARSDFFGGMWGLADSIEIVTGANFHLEDLSISVQEGDLSVDYGGENSFVVSDAFANQTWMRVGAVATPTSETTDNRGTARARLLELARARHPNAELLNSPSVPYFEGATGNGTSIRGDVIISNGSGNFDIDDRHTEDWSALYEYHNGENVAGGFSPEQILPEDGVDTTLEIEGGDDVFIAGDGSNTLRGRSGHDWLDGKGGADTLHGDEGDDVLLGGTGDDTLNGGLGDDYLHGGAGADTVNGGDGNDLIVLSSGVDTVSAGAGDDTIFVDQTIISSSSSAGVDEVNAGSGSDTLSFARITQPWSNVNGSGAVISEDDEDYIAGIRFELAGGSVWYGVKVDGNKVVNYSGIENVEGSNFEDALTGNAEANRIWGRDGNDTLSGGAGNDVLQGGVGADQISGGDGNDTASYSDSSGAVWIDLQSEEYFGGDAEGDSMSSIEFAEGSRFDDTFFGTSSYNEFYGLDGDDWFVYSAGNDKYYGGDGFDTIDLSELDAAKELRLTDPKYTDIEHILATDHADYLYGTDADETFQGGKGNDYLEGGLGSDTYIYHRGDGRDTIKDVLEGEGGHQDTLMFGEGIAWNDLVFTSLLQPGIFRITIRGESNTQSVSILNNWSGADGTSNEKRAQIDLIDVGGVGGIDIFDIERADFGNNGESNGVYGLISSGWDHDDVLQGNQFVNGEYRNHMDLLVGYGGNDTLTGHRGGFKGDEKGDIFIGGTGNDTISASKGDDQFVFERGDGQDTITDRGGVDIIQFGPNVAAEDVIVEYYEGDLYIGIRDLDKPALQAHLVADHIKVENLLGVHNWSIEMLSVGGAIINLEQIVVENAGAEAWVWDGYIGSITVDQNQPISNLLGQALSDLGYDPDGASDGNTTFSFKSGTAPAGLQIASNGIISGTPTEEGVHQVTIVATNDGKDTEKTFTLDVQFSNSPPTGSPTGNVNGGNEDTEITIRKSDLLQGFSDANGDSLEIANLNVQNASNGTIQSNGQGDYTLTPNNNYNGTIVLTYDVVDGNGGQLTGQTRSVQIDAVNDAPTGSPMGVIADANEDAPSTILTADLLRGFDDVDSEQLFVEGLDADHGTVVPDGNGNYTLTPDANYNGTITLSYRVSDGSGGRTSIQHQTVQVTAINDAPTGSPTASLGGGNEGADIAILTADLLRGFDDVDSEQLFVEGLDADHGTVASDGNGNYTLTPDANYNGTITLSYRVNDGSGGQTSIHHQTVQISAINDAPTGAPDGVLDDGVEDAPITIESSILLSGFSDVDPDTLSVVNLSSSNGTILPDGAGDFTLTPEANYNGPITLSYQVSDGNGGQTEVHTRELQVTSVNDVPVVSNPTLDQNATEAEAFSYTLPTNVFSDVDIDDILEITATLEDDSDLPHWLSFDNGVFTGTPPAGSEGALSIKVTADDGTDTVSDVFELTVGAGINTAPQAFDDTITATIYEDGVETLTASQFLSNDIDDDVGDTLSITGVDSVSTNGASVALDSDGNVVYDPNGQFDLAEGQTTTDTFNYTVSDGNGGTDTAIATVTVTGRGDTPPPTDVAPSRLLFGDSYSNGVSSWTEGNNGNSSTDTNGVLHIVGGAGWTQAGFSLSGGQTVDADHTILEFKIKRNASSSGQLILRDSSWRQFTVGNVATGVVSVDGVDGFSNLASLGAGEWHTVRINLDALGMGSFRIFGIQGDSHGNDAYELDDVAFYNSSYGLTGEGGGSSLSNTAPEAFDDTITATIYEDGAETLTASQFLSNDTDDDVGDTLSITGVDSVSTNGASVSLDSDGNVIYNPNGQFDLTEGQTTTDTFNYTVSDGNGGTDTAIATVTITGRGDTSEPVTGGNLLINGSFENPGYGAGTWNIVQNIEGWTAISGGSIEVWNDILGVTPSDGDHVVELDALGEVDGFYQDVQTSSGLAYTLSLDAKLRPDHPADLQTVQILWNGVVIAQFTPEVDWSEHTFNVVGTGGEDRLTVRELANETGGTAQTGGAVLDNFSLIAVEGGGDTANTAPEAFDDTITATIYEDGVETLTASQFLSNDIDDDVGDTLSITGVDSVSTNGASVALDSDGNVVYDPNGQFDLAEGQTTTDTFNYTVSDGNGGTDTAIATVTVTGRGDTPPPTDVAPSRLLFGDSYSNGVSSWTEGNNGNSSTDTNGVLHIVGGAGWTQAGFSLSGGQTVDADHTILEFKIKRNASSSGQLILRDSSWRQFTVGNVATGVVSVDGVDGFSNLASLGAGEWHTVRINLDALGMGSFRIFGIQGDSHGNDAYELDDVAFYNSSYGLTGEGGGSSLSNTAPEAFDDTITATIYEDGAETLTASQFLSNDTDDDVGDTLSITGVDSVSTNGASVSLDSDGNVIYNPNGQFDLTEGQTTTDTFNYTVSDGNGGTDTAIATVTITGRGDTSEPVTGGNLLINGSFEAPGHDVGTWNLHSSIEGWTAIDGGQIEIWNQLLGVQATDGNQHLELDALHEVDGLYQDVQTVDGQSYQLSFDASLRTDKSTENQSIQILWNGAVVATFRPEDNWTRYTFDVVGTGGQDRLTVQELASETGGDAGTRGALLDNFSLIAVEGGGDTANTAPEAFDDTITATIYEDGVETLTASQFLSNDIDDDVGDTLSITGVDSVSTNGASVALDSDGNVVYDPNGQFDLAEGQTTTDTFNYTVSDGNGGTDTAIATVTVTGRGDTSEPELPEEPTSYIPINGTSGGDHWIDQSGSQLYDGGDGWNSVEFAGTEEDYLFSYDEVKNEGIVLHIASGTYDRVRNINALRFTGDGSQYGKYRYFGLAQGTEGDDQEISIVGTHNAETIYGYGGNDIIEGGRGNDRLDGGSGWDRVNLDGVREDYEFIEHSNGVVVARNIHTGEQDALVNVEGIWFYGEQDDANLVDLITGTTQEPVPEYLNTPIEGNITTGGFQYPILIDLGGDGADLVSVTQSRIVFESDTGGPLMRMGWISAKDGMLVLDRDGDGIINKLSEISFVNDLEGAKTDLEGLRAYDTNFDGVFDAQDDSWALFQVWRDVNQNGIGRGSELASLEEMGISGIRLALTSVNESTDGYADSIVLNEASLITTDGVDRTIYDVALRGELAHVSGYVEGAVSPEWSTFSWTSDGAFGVAQSASNHSGDIEDLAELQTISSDSIWGQDIPLQDLVRYVDYNDELSIPDYLTFSDDDPLTPTFGVKPLVFDLDGNGLDLIDPGQSPIIRDMNGNGAEDRLGWIGSGDGLLALDRNGDGNIDPVSEISFVQDLEGAQTDLEGLVAYDTNNDGWFDADDAQFDQFQIWQDYNYNAISDEGELKSLFEAGIARISLTADESLGYQDSPLSNRVFGQAVFEWNDGTTGLFGDVELRGFSGSEIEQALERERRNNSINANDDIQARLEAMLEAQRRAEELVPNSGETSGVASASVSPESMLSAEDGSNPIERSHMSNINRLDKIAPEIKEGMPSIVQNDLQLTDIGESALSTNTPKRKWWKFGQRSDDVRSTPALGERLAKLDAEKQDIGVETNAQPTPTERQAGELAEKQRLMQAMASFKGSSGVPAVRKRDLDQDNSADIAVAKMNKKSGFGIRSLFN